ncbi:ankyrin repeat domain-containing protein [Histomonas meleagridis]|uniref:ankyrin repeat domain-containing protein n=1 Tax=Histomonas meleagridis TaxID=135588 RepID=UPI00355AC5E3|nr:ankyrin repeat domain-containing protein [Histomonas meleagridis]KAH0801172.1 ankyrin repeat domain-containing protein [Histomonas meleagridis]
MTTPVEIAWKYIKLNDIENLKKMVPREVDPNASIPDEKCEIRFLMHAAAAFGSLDCLKYLVDEGGDLNHANSKGYTVLHWAAYGGWDDVLAYLFSKNVLLDTPEKTGQTALHIASARGHILCVNFLAGHGSILDKPAGFKWSPLHFAISYGQQDAAEILISKGANPGIVDSLGRSVDVLAHEYKRKWWDEIDPSQQARK